MSRCLHHNPLGCIVQCPGRCRLHLYFGSVGLRLLPQRRGVVARLCAHHAACLSNPQCRRPGLPGPSADRMFLFLLEELFLPHDLLVSAGLLKVDATLARAERR